METTREALLAEELGSFYSNSNIFVFFKESKMQEPTPSSNQNMI
jgi:hypothetical protein